jgi:hypothetical protein
MMAEMMLSVASDVQNIGAMMKKRASERRFPCVSAQTLPRVFAVPLFHRRGVRNSVFENSML